MPQNINLNVSPYYDDFDENKNYYKVLFKPGSSVQARELTTLQSILQNQIEKFGTHFFKDGAMVIPGNIAFDSNYTCVEINSIHLGIPVVEYLKNLKGKYIIGQTSNIIAKIEDVIDENTSERSNNTLYIKYQSSSQSDFESNRFVDGENLIIQEDVEYSLGVLREGNTIATTISNNCTSIGSAVKISSGVYFIRGFFLDINEQSLILDQYGNTPSYRVGLAIKESFAVASNEFSDLLDNSQGFYNYAAPGADRLLIQNELVKKPLDDFNDDNFVQLVKVENGVLERIVKSTDYNILENELARRTYDESGDYYVTPFDVEIKESLNNYLGNNGIFISGQKTKQGSTPSEDLACISISPGKAYIKGYEVETISNTIIDLQKTRTTSTAKNQAIQFNFGTQVELNNVYGVIPVGYGTDSYVKLYTGRTSTVGVSSGSQIGVARIYDLKLKDKLYENSASVFEASLYDIQTYTSLEISSGLGKSLSESTYIEGKNSGASGFLVSGISSTSTSLDLYQVSGNFIQNESLVINGLESNRITKTVVDYGIDDVHQITSYISSPVTFTADTILSRNIDLTDNQSSYTITASSSGISTIRTSNSNFYANVKVGDIVAYTKPEDTLITYNVVKSVNSSLSLVTIGTATTVSGVNNGSLPTSLVTVNDLRKVTVGVGDINSSLYSNLNNRYVSTVDLNTSSISLRKTQYVPSINSTTFVVTVFNGNGDEILVPFDEEAYSLVYDDGTIEPLTSQKLIPNFDDANNPAQGKVTLRNLNITSTKNAYLTVTYQRVNCKPRKKTYNRCTKLTINKTNSGINTVGTGLVYSDVYGTRIEDNIISLNVSEVESIIGIYESTNNNDPVLPSLTVTTPFNEISNLIKGEEIIGEESKAVAVFVETDNVSKIEFSYLNDNTFKAGENITFKESRATTTISTINVGDKNIIRSYLFDNGSRQSYLDFSRIIRKPTVESPKKRITILYNYYSIDSNDNGTFVTVNSYDLNRYNRIPLINNYSCSDILDFRPRVTNYNTSSTLSPFDFRSRTFNVNASSAKDIVAKDTSIILSYNYYLPRIDKLFLSRYGEFNLISGIPSLTPKEPDYFDDSFEVATLYLPPYVYNVNDIRIVTNKHKRYTMRDISKLDDRISNVEYYTALSLLEVETQNLTIKDSSTNLDRFKSGFFVDNFSSFSKGDYLNKNFRVSIDNNNYLMRPEHYTSQLDLELSDADNINVKRVGDLVTLNYKDVSYLENKFATRTENINPFNVISWFGSLELKPSVDNWIDTDTVSEKPSGLIEEGDYETALKKYNADSNTGLSPTQWGAWENNWTGSSEVTTGNPVITSSSSTLVDSSILPFTGPFMPGFLMSVTVRDTVSTSTEVTTTTRGTRSRKGIRNKVTSKFDTRVKGSKVVNTSSIINIRSRNIGIISRKLKPNSRFYAFFDSQDVSSYITPKLIEIEMVSGTFVTGEKVEGNLNNASISFRLAAQNHMDGVYNLPSQTYSNNPYSVNTSLASNYSSSSTVLNVDIETLSLKTESEYYGFITPGMRLVGKTSGAIARVKQIRLISDNSGTFMGSFFIPDPSVPSNPKFTTGTKVFTLTTSPTISNTSGIFESNAEAKFTSSGTLEEVEITTLQVRNALVTQENVNNDPEAVGIVSTSTNTVTNTTSVNRTATNLLYVDPLAQSFLVTEETGVYVTKCDIFFKTKDSKGAPVTLEIREMANGVPIEKIIPYSQVTLYPKDVNVSDTSLVPTTFTFSSPVYLKGSTWYSIVLLSPSSDSYNVWISRMGEEDVTSLTNQEGNRVIVSAQPSIGSLFKSQNAYTWDPSQYEDLKFTLYRAEFTATNGTATFHNPVPGIDNKKITTLIENPITTYSRSLLVNLNTSLSSSEINLLQSGYTLTQASNSTFSSKVKSIVGGITTNTSLSIVNSGVGYTAGIVTYTNVDVVSLTGIGTGGKITIGVGTGSAYYATVTASGTGYAVGDVLTIDYKDTGNLGQNVVLTIPNTSGILTASNSLILDEVQGLLNTGSGDLIINGNTLTGKFPSTAPVLSDGLHFKVNHTNHGMYSSNNLVTLSGIESDVNPVKLISDITTSSTEVVVSDATKFTTFEGKSIGIGTTGYLLINNEIIGYVGVNTSTSTITLNNVAGHSRGVDNTVPTPHYANDLVFKYEFNGISLRKINKTHSMSDVDSSTYLIELDNYHIKIVEDSNKYFTNSKTGGSYLYTSTSSKTSKIAPRATQNDVYSILHPIVSVNTPLNTNVSSNIRTISASSVDGNEVSFIDNGYEEVALNSDNEFDSMRAIFSRVNELQYLNTPNNKSIFLQLQLSTNNTKLSPVIDLKRVSMLHIMNRIDSPVNNYITDSRINSLVQDPHSAIYVSRIVRLEKPADSLKVLFDAYRHESNDIRLAYRIFRNDTPDEYQVYQLFPGYGNIDSRGNTIDLSKSNGLPDTLITPSGTLDDFKAYEYNVRSNVTFTGFQIKIMMSGTDQANVPKVRDLRIIATI